MHAKETTLYFFVFNVQIIIKLLKETERAKASRIKGRKVRNSIIN
jgi:hypothetical protein